ncbi:LytR/AlgR family response regulator transcription factor [Pedobacter glucosidilyticus]|uniref:LytR/AlgR family response regulator transcription factor n=1 Tax=Pedobacter glucosidilyticus TaxID=1122941 RepID=UPI000422B46A|nr:LytTR family DNA-binding domain-containing protein [Pedobacter glucosidilyticus]
MNCYIIDDQESVIKTLSDYIRDTPKLNLVYSTLKAQEVIALLPEIAEPSIFFLDIDMPMINGLQIAEMVNDFTAVIFITGHPQYAVDAFNRGAYDYLLKPFSYDRFLKAINKINHRYKPKAISDKACTHTFVFNKYGELVKLNYDDIYYVRAEANYVAIHRYNNHILSRIRLKDIIAEFPMAQFIQVQKSYVIAINKIHKLSTDDILVMADEHKTQITIGRPFLNQFLECISASVTKHEKKSLFGLGR